jgi:hypothetical protein
MTWAEGVKKFNIVDAKEPRTGEEIKLPPLPPRHDLDQFSDEFHKSLRVSFICYSPTIIRAAVLTCIATVDS